jgi:hypothetical protein
MSPEKSLSRYILVVLSVSVVLTALVIVAINAYVNNARLSSGSNSFIDSTLSSFSYNQGYKDGYNAARDRFNIMPLEIRAINGEIIDITNDSVTINAVNLNTDEFVDDISNLRKAIINEDTKIFARTALSEEDFDKQLSAWRSTGAMQGNPPPTGFTQTEIKLSDLKVGDTAVLTANQDIRLMETFTAESVVRVE